MPVSRDCLFCATRFTAVMQRRLFCSAVCRVRYNREEKLRCFYCGELATDRDHVWPHSAQTLGERRWRGQETVNACGDCNGRLGAQSPGNLEKRIEVLMASVAKEHKLQKTMPEWNDEELGDLGASLRKRIAGKIRARQRAIERFLHMQAVLHLLTTENPLKDD
jgi:hypothetical protein